ncbi:hypothetical protein N7456_006126 [Penicillium angulare]|uniref:Peptidase A1 domain-containing protein n=1 Tax=Penicillium angulare TaxID=116970 RepID=A0A9W9FZQ5_9EURO|nr:hypothetical protein N7456_006126 [Penicillium angulare]
MNLLLLLGILAWREVGALSLSQTDKPAVLKLPIQRADSMHAKSQKRDSVISAPFGIEDPSLYPQYYANLTIGTPPQAMSMLSLDTTTGVIEITATNSTLCTQSSPFVCSSGYFDVNASSTYKFISNDPTDEADFPVDFGSDNVTISDLTLSSVDLVVNMGSYSNNFIGVGYTVNDKSDAPATILQAMINQGQIKSAAYSLWVDEPTGTTGTILFGGVDTTKYTGDLYTMPIPAVNGTRYLPAVLMTEVTVQTSSDSPGNSSSLPTYMVIDSTSSQTVLPTEIVEQVFKDLNITWNEEYHEGIIDCSISEKDYNITFTFCDFGIKIPISDFIDTSSPNGCQFEILPTLGGTPILSNSFLRRTYIVYDLSNHVPWHTEISMGRMKIS